MFLTDTKDRFCFIFCEIWGNIHSHRFHSTQNLTETELENFGFIVNED
jgi:hypothetical protein